MPFHSTHALQGRSLLALTDFSAPELRDLVATALALKAEARRRVFPRRLAQRKIALVFLVPSCRTLSSFVVAAADEGAHLQAMGASELRFGVKESPRDIARVLGRLFDAVAMRADDATLAAFARAAGRPVWNALSPAHHPTQALADMMTLHEAFGRVAGLRVAFVGDGRSNVAASLALAAGRFGIELAIVAPRARWPEPGVLAAARAIGGRVRVTEDVAAGVDGADAVYGDIWVSMGQEAQAGALAAALAPYRITAATMRATHNPRAIFLHCLPALHDDATQFGREHPDARDVDDEVFEGPASRVFDQAENRMHTIKALMLRTLAGDVDLGPLPALDPAPALADTEA